MSKTWAEMLEQTLPADAMQRPRPTPLVDRRKLARARGEAIALAYEIHRGAAVHDSSQGYDPYLRAILKEMGCEVPQPPSADLVSTLGDEVRLIEVKARGGYGDVSETPERELDTLRAAGQHGWLYAVYNVTQRGDYELWTVQDPANRLAWVMTHEAERPSTMARGVRHEARFTTTWDEVRARGIQVDLTEVPGLPLKD